MPDLFCQNCGTKITSAEKCSNCKTIAPIRPISSADTVKTCSNCAAPNHATAKYCFSCGQQLTKKAKTQSATMNMPAAVRHEALRAIADYQNSRGGNMNIVISKNQKRIGLWGPHEAGKTVYMLSMYIAGAQSGTPWTIGLENATDETRAKFDELANNLLVKGIWPGATIFNANEKKEPDIYNFLFYPDEEKIEIARDKEEKDSLKVFWNFITKEPIVEDNFAPPGLSISFADVAGERYLSENSDSPLWQHLAGCHGLLCLLDPENFTEQFSIAKRLVGLLKDKVQKEKPEAMIGNGRYLPHRVALCFSKMDCPDWAPYIDDPIGLIGKLEEESGFNIQKILKFAFSPNRTSYHCISSVGTACQPEESAIKLPNKIHPTNIFDPLNLWVKEKFPRKTT